ncbi:MAG: hypothetical protein KatS3mg050_1719 [Litorilinea sp.]|nr:MAG: hypothetical protein KatS3mg050_1719 [Litorilinea sp.]
MAVAAGLILGLGLMAGCAPSPELNVLGYLVARRLGTLDPAAQHRGPVGSLEGIVTSGGRPLAGATVLVAERLGRPHAAQTDAAGRFRLDGIPVGQYVPAAVAPGHQEMVPRDWLGLARLVTIRGGQVTQAPPLALQPYLPPPLPEDLAGAVALTHTGTWTATTNFPPGAAAQVMAFSFQWAGAQVDSLRLYLPPSAQEGESFPWLFMVYPTHVDNWQPVSVAFASQGYAMVAISPVGERGMDIDAHTRDARVAFELARQGALSRHILSGQAIFLGGSFSSAIVPRLLRDVGEHAAAWVSVGGISNAFSLAADFYAGRLEMPPQYELAVPALGPPNVYPLPFLRASPVYWAGDLPPTMLVHTDADRIAPITQAYEFEAALRAAGVPVQVYYYQDVSHYLQIGEDLTDVGVEMYYRILEFMEVYR